MEVKFELNLQDLCTVNIADSLWNSEKILNKTKLYLCSPSTYNKLKMWDMLTKEVVDLIDPKSLPEYCYTELVYAVDSLGKQKRDFFTYCKMRNIFRDVSREHLYENYFKRIYWTYYGVLDVEKIIKSWFGDPDCDLWKVYIMASCFCSEEFIKKVWVQARQTYKHENFKKLFKSYGWHLAAYWDRYFRQTLKGFMSSDDTSYNFMDSFYSGSKSIQENMFKLSVGKGFKLATQKFFFELTEKEIQENLYKYLDSVVDRHYRKEDRLMVSRTSVATYFRENQSMEILLFLLNHVDLSQIRIVQEHEGGFFEIDDFFYNAVDYLTRWPYVKLVIPYAVKNKQYMNDKIYEHLLSSMDVNQRQKYFQLNKDSIYQRKFHVLWQIIPEGVKKKIGKNPDFASCFLYSWNLPAIKTILNDKYLKEARENIIAKNRDKFETYVEENNAEKIKEFMDLLIPTELGKDTQINMEMIYQHLLNGEFDSADQILKSCHSEEEKVKIKNSVNTYIMCIYFIKKNQLNLADEFLLWKFNSDSATVAYKLKFIKDPFTLHHILKLWDKKKELVEEAKLQSSNFIKWFLRDKSAKSINCFKTSCKKDKNLNKLIEYQKQNFSILDDFLVWCLMSKKEIQSFKRKCFSEKDKTMLMMTFLGYMRKNNWEAAEEFLNWKFTSTEKFLFMNNFLRSKRWVFECILFTFKTCSSNVFGPQVKRDEVMKEMEKFIKTWMRPVEKRTLNDLKNFLVITYPQICLRIMEDHEKKLKTDSYSTDEYDIEGSEFDLSDAYSSIGLGDDYDEGHIKRFLDVFQASMLFFYNVENGYYKSSDDDDDDDDFSM